MAAEQRSAGLGFDGSHIAEVAVDNVAGRDVVHGVSPEKLAEMMDTLIRYQFHDDQRREIRQGQLDEERRAERNNADYQWAMVRQRFDVVMQRLDRLDATASETRAEARRVRRAGIVLASVVSLLAIAVIILTADRYYFGGRLLLAMIGAVGALAAYYQLRAWRLW